MRAYVIPLTHLRTVASVYLPVDGKYAVGNSHKPRKDWTRYEDAWHLLGGVKRALSCVSQDAIRRSKL
jgi:hypothetical protein